MALKIHIHGIQYNEANSLGAATIPRIRSILEDEAKKQYWGNATAMLGSIGTPESYRILDHFIWKRFRGEVDSDTYWALTSGVSVLGLTCGAGNPAALQALHVGATPESWAKLPWHVRGKSGEKVQALLSRLSLRGIGYCIDPEADRILAVLERDPRFKARNHEIKEARALHAEVARHGLGAYMKAQRPKYDR